MRAGGDEFYILGIGAYEEKEIPERIEEFSDTLMGISKGYQKAFSVTASMGCALQRVDRDLNVDSVIRRADEEMYRMKVNRKKQRD